MKKKYLYLVVLCLCTLLCVSALVACGNTDNGGGNGGGETTAAFTFTGDVNIGGTDFNVKLYGKDDKTFTLKPADNLPAIAGTYVFEAGKGYTFTFADTANTVKKTTYDKTTKEHKLTYLLVLATGGKGDVTLTLKDEAFVPDETPPAGVPAAVFTGTTQAGGMDVEFTLTIGEDGRFVIKTNFSSFLPDVTGDCTFINNTYRLTAGDKTYESVYDSSSKTYTIPYEVVGPQFTVSVNLVYVAAGGGETEPAVAVAAFTGSGTAMNINVDFTLTLYGDGNCQVTTSQSFLAPLDGTFAYDRATNVYTFLFGGTEYASVYDAGEKTYTVPFTYAGREASIDFDFTYRLATFGGDTHAMGTTVYFNLALNPDGTCVITSSNTFVTDVNGTYTFADNVYTVRANDRDYVSTYDDATGVYTLPYTVIGLDETMSADLTYDVDAARADVAEFKGSGAAMGTNVAFTLTLRDDHTCKIAASLGFIPTLSGTYTFIDNEYAVYLNGKYYRSTAAEGVYTIAYSYAGRDATIEADLVYTPPVANT